MPPKKKLTAREKQLEERRKQHEAEHGPFWKNNYREYQKELKAAKDLNSPIYVAAQTGNLKELLRLIREGKVDVDQRGEKNNTALIAACEMRKSGCAKALIEAGCDVLAVNDAGLSALHKASYTGCTTQIIIMLLERKADPNLQDTLYGNTPLHKACEYHQKESARLMVLASDHTIKNLKGKTAFDMASKETLDYLYEYMDEVERRKEGEKTISYKEVKPLGKYFQTEGEAMYPENKDGVVEEPKVKYELTAIYKPIPLLEKESKKTNRRR